METFIMVLTVIWCVLGCMALFVLGYVWKTLTYNDEVRISISKEEIDNVPKSKELSATNKKAGTRSRSVKTVDESGQG